MSENLVGEKTKTQDIQKKRRRIKLRNSKNRYCCICHKKTKMYSSSPITNLTSKMWARKLWILIAITLQHFISITNTAPASASSSPFLDGRPRCGVIESSSVSSFPADNSFLRRFYVVDDSSSSSSSNNNNNNNNKDRLWPRPYLTYRIASYSSRLPPSLVDDALARAFAVWSSATPFRFTRVVDAAVEPDIVLKFASRFHGDAWAFDGPRGVLAHAFRPNAVYDALSGDVHFDDEEDWTVKSIFGINLMQLAAHEIGHSLGFKHVVDDPISIMWPYAKKYDPSFGLSFRDIETARKLYPRFFEMAYASGSPPPGSVYFDNKNDKRTTKLDSSRITTGGIWNRINNNVGTTKRVNNFDTTFSSVYGGSGSTSKSGVNNNNNDNDNKGTTPKWIKSGGNKMTTWKSGSTRSATVPHVWTNKITTQTPTTLATGKILGN